MNEQPNPLRLLHPWQVALILGLSERTLERYRARGSGPEYIRVEGRIRYSEPGLLKYLKKNTVTDQSDDPAEEPDPLADLQALLEKVLTVLLPGGV